MSTNSKCECAKLYVGYYPSPNQSCLPHLKGHGSPIRLFVPHGKPMFLTIVLLLAVAGSVEHGTYYAVKMMYEHILERTSHSMTHGPFGGVKSKFKSCHICAYSCSWAIIHDGTF